MTAPGRYDDLIPKRRAGDSTGVGAYDDLIPETASPKRTLGGMVKAAANLALHTNPLTAPFTDTGRKVGRELTQGATFGWGEEGEAALSGALSPGTIKEHLARIRGERQTFKAEHPVAALGSEVLGGLGVGVPGASALLKGAKGPISKALRLSGIGAGTGAVAGAGMAEDGGRLKGAAIGAGVGAVAAPLIGGGAALLPKLGRLMGITTQGGRSEAALKALNDAVERSGQTMEEVTARAEAMVAAGKTPTLLDALGPGGRTALDAMAPLGNEAAGQAAQAARGLPKGEVAQALARASRRPTAKVGISPFGPKLGLLEKGATMGLRKSASRESEALLNQLLDPASKTIPGRVVGKIEPKPTIAEALAERQAAKIPQPETPSGYEPNANPVRESEAFIARKLKHQGITKPSHGDPIVSQDDELMALLAEAESQPDNKEAQGIVAQLRDMLKMRNMLGNERGALGKQPNETIRESALRIKGQGTFTGKTHFDAVQSMKEKGLDVEDFAPEEGFITSSGRFVSRKEAMRIAGRQKQLTVGPFGSELHASQMREKPPGYDLGERGALGVEGAKPPELPERISNPTDPYAEITKSAGPETPELARVKLLRKTLGMKGKIDPALLMLLGSGGVAGGALTAALALRRRGKRQQERASRP